MLTKSEAIKMVSAALLRMGGVDDPYIIDETSTLERQFGWVFFYNTKTFIETGEFAHRLAGNGPVVVDRDTGEMEFFGATVSLNELIDEYEHKWTVRHGS